MIVVVLVVIVAVLTGVHWYLWRRLVRDTTVPGSKTRRLGTIAICLMPVLFILATVANRAGFPFWLQKVVAWPGYMWGALLLYSVLALFVGEAVRPLLNRTVKKDAPDAERRLFVSRTVAVAASTVAVTTVGLGAYNVFKGPSTKRIVVPLAKLPRSAHGFRIAVVSDIHLGAILGRAHAQRVTDAVNATQPDLIAIVGDMVDGDVEDLRDAAAPLAQLRARHGAFFVTGNHEYFSGAQQWIDHVQELGLRPLVNTRFALDAFDLAGVNDLMGEEEGQGPDFVKALGDRDRSRAAILMAHQPVVIHDAVKHGVDLQLSGHSHGGQMWPGNYLAELQNPTVAGLESYGDTQLYVTRGAGTWGPPVRVGAPSDITIIQLASRQA